MEAEKLDKSARDKLPADHFAVPGKRKLPISDIRHTKLAWDMLERTQGLTPSEKSEARKRILRRASELGIDTTDWHKVKGAVQIEISAMALNISNDDGHPNKMPFSGCLVKLDEESTEAPHGTGGRRIILTSEAAHRALESLLGMAVDFCPAFDGHDAQAKVGIITSANIVGNEIQISGFLYSADFSEIAASIKALKTVLGFSFEAQDISVLDPGADVLTITDLTFTGAAILRKDKAAYQTTSLAASAVEDFSMNADELKELFAPMLAEAIKPLSDKLAASETANVELKKAMDAQAAVITANAAVMSKVEPHAANIESCACAMEAAGVGADPKSGHAAVLHRMASSMRSESAVGKVPHIFRDHDYPYSASADKGVDKDDMAKAIAAAVETSVKPLQEQIAAAAVKAKEADDKLAAASTQIKDLKAGKRNDSTPPERKTLTPAISAILARAHLSMPTDGDGKMARSKVSEVIRGLTNVTPEKKVEMKLALEKAGIIDEAA